MVTPTDANVSEARRPSAPDRSVVLESHYAGEPIPCPVGCGETAEVVHVTTLDAGAGRIWAECRGCAQRVAYEVPAATAAEREVVVATAETERQPVCPRHRGRVGLARRGRRLICPSCGVRFREA